MEGKTTGKRGLEKDMKSPEHKKPREQTEKQQTEEQQTIGEQSVEQQTEREQTVKMRTFEEREGEYNRQLEIETLSKICNEAEDMNSEVKKLIGCYVVNGVVWEMKDNMQDVGKSEEENTKFLKQAIQFVNNNKEEIEEKGIEDLTSMLIKSLRNKTTAEYCRDCSHWYIVGRESKPKRYCDLCDIGMHDCLDVKEDYRKGEIWLCCDCHEGFTTGIKPQIFQKHWYTTFKGFSDDKSSKDTSAGEEMETEEKEAEEEEKEEGGEIEIEEGIVSEQKDNKQETRKENSDNKGSDQGRKKCYFWINSKCKFGDKCRSEHPTRCQETLENGTCSKGDNCKLEHPKICWNILRRQYCDRKFCRYTHPSKMENRFVSGNNNNNQQGYANQQRQNQNQNNFNSNNNGQRGGNNSQGGWDSNRNHGYDNPMNGQQNPTNNSFFTWGPTPMEAYGREMNTMRTQMIDMELRLLNQMKEMKEMMKKE